MSRETTVYLHRAIFVLVAMLTISLVMNIQIIILAKAINLTQIAQTKKIINGTDTVSFSYTSFASINSIAKKK
jgi:hypothetical protein